MSRRPQGESSDRLFPPASRRRPAVGESAPGIAVLTAREELVEWDRRRLARSIQRQCAAERPVAEAIAGRVESQVRAAGLKAVTTTLIRELVAAELTSLGMGPERHRSLWLGLAAEEVSRELREPSSGLSSQSRLGRRLVHEYALESVFSLPVVEAHRRGQLHLHDLDLVDRPQTIRLDVPTLASSRRSRSGGGEAIANQLLGSWRALGPRVAERLVLDRVDLAVGGRPAGSAASEAADLVAGLVREVEASAADRPRLALRLAAMGREDEASPAARSAWEGIVGWLGGLNCAVPLELEVELGPRFFSAAGHRQKVEDVVMTAGSLSSLRFCLARPGDLREGPGLPPAGGGHAVVLSSVSVGFPRAGYLAEGDAEGALRRLKQLFTLAAQAHDERRVFLEDLLARGARGPLGPLRERAWGAPLQRFDEAWQPIVPCGLDELVEHVSGASALEDDDALELGERILVRVRAMVQRLRRKTRLPICLGAEPDPAVARRLATLDLQYQAAAASRHVRGDLKRGEVSYTPGPGLECDRGPGRTARWLDREWQLLGRTEQGAVSTVRRAAWPREPAAAAGLLMEIYARTRCRELRIQE